MKLTRRLFLAVALALAATPALAADWLLSFEAVPGGDPAGYTERATRTTELVSELVPPAFEAIGLDANAMDVEIAPGGYQRQVNASVLLHYDGERDRAELAAQALALVFEQQSVLVWRDGGDTLAVTVSFPNLTPNLAAYFFQQASAAKPGLGGGFSTRGEKLWFINLRGPDGKPLGGLADAEFEAALKQAAQMLGGTTATAKVDAHLALREQAVMPVRALPILERLRARRASLLR